MESPHCRWQHSEPLLIHSLESRNHAPEISQMAFNCIDGLWFIHTMKYYSAVKRNTLLMHTQHRRRFNSLSRVKAASPQRGTHCMSIYATFWERQNYRDGQQISSLRGLGRWEGQHKTMFHKFAACGGGYTTLYLWSSKYCISPKKMILLYVN